MQRARVHGSAPSERSPPPSDPRESALLAPATASTECRDATARPIIPSSCQRRTQPGASPSTHVPHLPLSSAARWFPATPHLAALGSSNSHGTSEQHVAGLLMPTVATRHQHPPLLHCTPPGPARLGSQRSKRVWLQRILRQQALETRFPSRVSPCEHSTPESAPPGYLNTRPTFGAGAPVQEMSCGQPKRPSLVARQQALLEKQGFSRQPAGPEGLGASCAATAPAGGCQRPHARSMLSDDFVQRGNRVLEARGTF